MNNKKIEFSKKPSLKETNLFLDKWVKNSNSTNSDEKKLKRTTIYLPDQLHKKLKLSAINEGTSMTDIIINILEKNLH